MTAELREKIHRQTRRAPVVAHALDAPPTPAPLGGQLPDQKPRALVGVAAVSGRARQGEIAVQQVELSLHTPSLRRASQVFEGLYAYISSGVRSRPAE